MRQSYLIIYNSLTNYGRAFIQGIISFLLVPFIISRIDSEQYGIVILATTAYGMIALFGNGLGKAVIKYHAQARAKDNLKLDNLIFNNSLLLFFSIGIIGSIIVFFLSLFFKDVFPNVPPNLVGEGKTSLLIIALTIIPCILLDVFKGMLLGEQCYDIVNLIGIGTVIFRAIGVVLYFLLVAPSLLAVIIIYSFSYIIERLGYLYASYKIINKIKLSVKYISKYGIKMIVVFSGMVLIATMANMLAAHFFKFIIGAKLTLQDLTYYGVLLLLTTTANLLVRSFVNVLVPVASKYQELGDFHRIKKILIHGTKYSLIIVISLMFITIPFLKSLLKLWMGDVFVHIWIIGFVMFLAQIISSSSTTANQVLSGLGRVKLLAMSSSLSVFIGLGLSLLYIFLSSHPILLIAVLLISTQRLVNSTIVNIYAIKNIRMNFLNLIKDAYLYPLIIGGIVLFVSAIIVHFIEINNWLILFLCGILIEIVYYIFIYLFSLNTEEKILIKSFSSKSFLKLKSITNS